MKFILLTTIIFGSLFGSRANALDTQVAEREQRHTRLQDLIVDCFVKRDARKLYQQIPWARLVDRSGYLTEMLAISCQGEQVLRAQIQQIRLQQSGVTKEAMLWSQRPDAEDGSASDWLAARIPWKSAECPTGSVSLAPEDLYNRHIWHQALINWGWACAAKLYQDTVQRIPLNQAAKRAYLSKRKSTKRSGFNLNGLRIGLIPHFRWEEYGLREHIHRHALNRLIPPLKKIGNFESVTDLYLDRALRQQGAIVYSAFRSSSAHLDDQARQTYESLKDLWQGEEPWILIARSSGSQVYLRMIEMFGESRSLRFAINLFGTPFGSFRANELGNALAFYGGVLPQAMPKIDKSFLLFKFPTIGNWRVTAYQEYLKNALNRENILSLGITQDKRLPLVTRPVLNVASLPTGLESFSQMAMGDEGSITFGAALKYGPSEGSSLWADLLIPSAQSATLLFDADHWIFSDPHKFSRASGFDFISQLMRTSNQIFN